MESFFGSILFEWLGAFVKWIYARFNVPAGKRPPSFERILKGKRGNNDIDDMLHGVSNIAVGVVTTMIFAAIVVACSKL